MKLIKITKGFSVQVDDEDYEKLSKHKWFALKNGSDTYYAARGVWCKDSKKITVELMHRVIMSLNEKTLFVDHIDRNGLNNQKYNLRIATKSQNNSNRKPSGKSKYLGVSRHGTGWQAQLNHNKKKVYIGKFKTEEAAALAYNEIAIKLHGEFTNINQIK